MKNENRKRPIYAAAIPLLILGMVFINTNQTHAQTDTFTASGNWTVPSGVTSAVFEAWGGGAAGAGTTARNTGGAGGGGGHYAKTTLSGLTSGQIYAVTVAPLMSGNTSTGCTGNDSWVKNPSTNVIVYALGGIGDTLNIQCSSNGIQGVDSGDTTYGGGAAASGSGTTATSGAGGGAAGPLGAGGAASGTTGGTGNGTNSGSGAAGLTTSSNGNPGNNYGGGGSGAAQANNTSRSGGTGAQGLVTVTYSFNLAPNTPTAIFPTSGATGVSTSPTIQMSATDGEGDAVQYKISLYNTTSTSLGNCAGTLLESSTQSSSGTGWDNGTTAYASGATASYTVQTTLTSNTGYCWTASAIDPGGSNTYSIASNATTFTTAANVAPAAPTLLAPATNQTTAITSPIFQLRATDANADYLEYKILIYSSDCSTNLQTYDQTVSQAGWAQQNQNSGTAYTGASTLSASSVALFGGVTLSPSASYCWKAAAIDPGGSNTWSSYSGTSLFTTSASNGAAATVNGGSNITGGTWIR